MTFEEYLEEFREQHKKYLDTKSLNESRLFGSELNKTGYERVINLTSDQDFLNSLRRIYDKL